ncbi:LLM class flavin-dependent oxidoreductase [Agromyces sp. MMS24-JH15]|uniref:LLM class flavin-dependent oxidoreductase n=1 Tax=Agromyces sp. MMS24-JH15 TaxID=3243765 RepID=UPI003747BF41
MADRERSLRLGFFTYMDDSPDAAEAYQRGFELFALADELGLDTGWVAQHHFGRHGSLPNPFPYLSAVAARTHGIGVGTAIVALPYEEPLRLAEDAAVFETLYPGRLQLGLGTGGADRSAVALGKANIDRREALERELPILRGRFAGENVAGENTPLHPPAPALADRLWVGSGSPRGVEHAGSNGAGLLLSRTAWGPDSARTSEVQVALVEAYQNAARAHGHEPRIGVSRTIYPGRDRASALADLVDSVVAFHTPMAGHGMVSEASTVAEIFAAHNIHYGSPDDIVESLLADRTLAQADELVFQVQPGQPGFDALLRTVRTVATEIAPALGWRPRWETQATTDEHTLEAVAR